MKKLIEIEISERAKNEVFIRVKKENYSVEVVIEKNDLLIKSEVFFFNYDKSMYVEASSMVNTILELLLNDNNFKEVLNK